MQTGNSCSSYLGKKGWLMSSLNFSCCAQTAKKCACGWGLMHAPLGYSLFLLHPLTPGMCLCYGELMCGFQPVPPSHMAVHSGLMLVLYAWNSGKCARVEFIWTAQSKWRLGLQTRTENRLQPIKGLNLRCYPSFSCSLPFIKLARS